MSEIGSLLDHRSLLHATALSLVVACSSTTDANSPPPPPPGVATVEVSPPTATLTTSTTMQLAATARDATGTEITGVQIAWSSENTEVATVSGTGLVTAVAAGQTSISALTAGVTGTGAVTVVAPGNATIVLQPGTMYQTMLGWEVAADLAQRDSDTYVYFKDEVFDRLVNELGINRLRAELHAGMENPVDYYAQWRAGTISETTWKANRRIIINDNADPNVINPAGYSWAWLDEDAVNMWNPMKALVEANGESLYINLCFIDFGGLDHVLKSDPAEYAEFILASVQHIQSTYGWVPDAIEMILEADLAGYSPAHVGRAIAATEARLSAAGYTGMDYIAPSVTNASNAPSYFDTIVSQPGVPNLISELSYHRYAGASTATLQAIAGRAAAYGIQTAHLEYRSDYHDLLEDITTGMNSSWAQFTMAAGLNSTGQTDNGGKYYVVNDANPSSPVVSMGWRTPFLRQYMYYVRRGAVRIGTTSQSGALEPVAFINADGRYVVVVSAASSQGFTVGGLPGGIYSISYSTDTQSNVDQADVTITAGTSLSATIPAGGVITIYGK